MCTTACHLLDHTLNATTHKDNIFVDPYIGMIVSTVIAVKSVAELEHRKCEICYLSIILPKLELRTGLKNILRLLHG